MRAARTTAFAEEGPPPLTELQERRLRRYLNWYWRRVQLRESPRRQEGTCAQAMVEEIYQPGFVMRMRCRGR